MTRLWPLLLLCGLWSPLCLSAGVSYIGTPQECAKAEFVPGYNLGGEGFDIVTMERKGAYVIDMQTWNLGNGTCRLYSNSIANREKQKVPATVIDWRIYPKCNLHVSSLLYDSVETLANDTTSSVSNNWKLGLKLPVDPSVSLGVGFGGSHSKETQFAIEKSKKDRYTFFSHSVDCRFYGYRLEDKPPLSHAFQSAVNSNPSYHELIDTYGTHFITQVSLGGKIKAVTSVKTCEASMKGLTATEVKDCLEVEASASFANTASIESMIKHCQGKKKKFGHSQSFSSEFSERTSEVIGGDKIDADVLFNDQSNPSVYNHWVDSLKSTPDVIKYNLRPLHTILPENHPARAGLKQEVEKYIKNNAVLSQCSETCTIGHRAKKRDPCACVCNSNQNLRSNCCPAGKGLATLKVFRLYATGLYGDVWTETDGSVEVKFGDQTERTAIIDDNDNPRWPETFQFGPITINLANELVFSVYDEDSYWNSDLLGKCSVVLRAGAEVRDSCMFDDGTLFFSYEAECAPSLGGQQCQEYIPSPMSPSLAKVFYSRNGVLLGDTGQK
ncbi:perforin-1-like [Notothenia coriiceps]|uniref:Perforin-1-like n=1 Tax=Notothenia coriiceps TaxID=8208 RepID=A0A6I9NPU6_9TELE|nr:PREDICTED: perforin-1-like [Notothenia coriiceps]